MHSSSPNFTSEFNVMIEELFHVTAVPIAWNFPHHGKRLECFDSGRRDQEEIKEYDALKVYAEDLF